LYENFTRGELFMAVSGAGLAAAVVLAGLFRWLGPRRLET